MDRSFHKRVYLPPLLPNPPNANNSARQMFPSEKTRWAANKYGFIRLPLINQQANSERRHAARDFPQENQQSSLPSVFQHDASPRAHTDGVRNSNAEDKVGDLRNGLDDIDIEMIRDKISKMKREKIMKKVRTNILGMLTRVQSMTDCLKTQLDDVMKEHAKANKLAKTLQSHVQNIRMSCNLQADLDNREHELDISREYGSYRTIVVPQTESANSSRISSLADVKNKGSQQSLDEGYRHSKTKNIRKIARKKSLEHTHTKRKLNTKKCDISSTELKPTVNGSNCNQNEGSDIQSKPTESITAIAKMKIKNHATLATGEGALTEDSVEGAVTKSSFQNKINTGFAALEPAATEEKLIRNTRADVLSNKSKQSTNSNLECLETFNATSNSTLRQPKLAKKKKMQTGRITSPKYYCSESVNGSEVRIRETADNNSSANSGRLGSAEKEKIRAMIKRLESCIIQPKKPLQF